MKKGQDKPTNPPERMDTTIRLSKKPPNTAPENKTVRVDMSENPHATSPGLLIKITGKPQEKGRAASREADESILSVKGGEKYKVGPIVAEGGMGVVREAVDLACQRVVAIKALPPGREVPAEYRTRFIEEAQITSQLEHPNIVPVHELGFDTSHNVYYTMKFIKGVTLTEVLLGIRRGIEKIVEQYPLSRLLTVFQKACDAIAFAHYRGICHCDIKPDNIMICDFGEVVVMDWGLARPIGRDAPEVPAGARAILAVDQGNREKHGSTTGKALRVDLDGRTTTARVMGTPGFLAPERVMGEGVTDARSDIYSLGATLYSILTLRAPLSGGNTREILRRIVKGDIVPPVKYNDPAELAKIPESVRPRGFPHCPECRIPPVLSDIVMKALSTEPEDRYATVQEMQAEIESYQTGLIWHLVVDEDFSGPDPLARWEVIGGRSEVRDGELHLAFGEPQGMLYKGDVSGDVAIEFECRQEGVYLNSAGCFLNAVKSESRQDTPLTGYKFEYGGFDNSMNVIERAGRQMAHQPMSALVRGVPYKIRAERVGGRLKLTVNNTEVLSVSDLEPLAGADRTGVGVMGWLAETVYTRIRIYTLGAPWKSDVIDVAERHIQKGNYAVATTLLKDIIDSYPDAARLERARRAVERAHWREQMTQNLETWRQQLRAAWPGVPFDLRLSGEGLALEIGAGQVEDLSPLRGLPLISLTCYNNRVKSFEPLRGMSLTALHFSGNPISSLEPLRGMPISVMIFEDCQVGSLEPLRGMPITLLNFGGNRVKDLEPLRNMPLTFLCFWGNRVKDLEPLRGMKALAALYFSDNDIEDLDPLRGLPLSTVNCSGNRIRSLEPLRGMGISVLHFGDNQVESLDPLRGMPLKMISCHCNRVTTLEPLEGAPLASVTCGGNRLTDLGSFVHNLPDDLRFDCDSLPTEELERVRKTWAEAPGPKAAVHLRQLQVLLALRRGDPAEIRALASEFRGHRYLAVHRFLRWQEAKELADRLGGHLAVIRSAEENEFVTKLFPAGAWSWFGLRMSPEGLEWVTGEPVTYTNFVNPLQERRVGPKIFSGRWTCDDVPEAHNSFIIEWDR